MVLTNRLDHIDWKIHRLSQTRTVEWKSICMVIPFPLRIAHHRCEVLPLVLCSTQTMGVGNWWPWVRWGSGRHSKNYFSLLSRYRYHEWLELARPKGARPLGLIHYPAYDERSLGLNPATKNSRPHDEAIHWRPTFHLGSYPGTTHPCFLRGVRIA